MIDRRKLIEAGCHFGHQKARGCAKMAPYVWGYRNGIQFIDVSKTAYLLEQAAQFLQTIASEGKTILWVGTKRSAQEIVFNTAQDLKMPYVNHRWIGGTLSNFSQVKKSVTKYLHDKDVVAKAAKSPEQYHYTKKEINVLHKAIERLEKNIGGIIGLKWPVGAIVLIDVNKEQSALKEAARMKVPVVALVDTNSDPSLVNYVIPGNDDAPRSISLIINYLHDAVKKGAEEFSKKKQELDVTAQAESQERKKSGRKEVESEKITGSKKDLPGKRTKTKKIEHVVETVVVEEQQPTQEPAGLTLLADEEDEDE
jgi:small subunit ribosomal protein S2